MGFLGRNTGGGGCTYDALYDTLEEDRLSFIVGVLHRIAWRSSRDQGRTRGLASRPISVAAGLWPGIMY